jgi:hypothetical protein
MQAIEPLRNFKHRAGRLIQSSWRRVAVVVLLVLCLGLVLAGLLTSLIALSRYVKPGTTAERNEFVRTVAQIAGAIAIAASLFFTWKTLVENQRANRERERMSQEGNITDRFTKAVEQLGAANSEGKPQLELRLGGIYALERIARDSERDHWPIMQIFAAYIRMNAPFKPTDYKQMALMLSEGKAVDWLKENRPRADIGAIVQAILNRERSFGNGESYSFELTHCDLHGAVFYETHAADLAWSNFSYSNLTMVNLSFAKLQHANFAGARLDAATLEGADLQQASFLGSNLLSANLRLAHLEGADFTGANLYGANLIMTSLHGANIEAAASLQDTVLFAASGLTDEQRRQCAARGARIEASAG